MIGKQKPRNLGSQRIFYIFVDEWELKMNKYYEILAVGLTHTPGHGV